MILRRGVGSALLTELAKPTFWPVLLVNLDWPSGEVWFHTNRGTILWDSKTWGGVGPASQVSVPEETVGLASTKATVRLVGSFDHVLDTSEEQVKNLRAAIHVGCTTARAGSTLVGHPVPAFMGVMDGTVLKVEDDSEKQIYYLELVVASGPSARAGAAITHSGEDQKHGYPSDTAGRHTQFAVAEAGKIT